MEWILATEYGSLASNSSSSDIGISLFLNWSPLPTMKTLDLGEKFLTYSKIFKAPVEIISWLSITSSCLVEDLADKLKT